MRDGWCERTKNLTRVSVMPNNKRYLTYKDKYIIGKSSQESEDFDLLVFARRDIETAINEVMIMRYVHAHSTTAANSYALKFMLSQS